MRDVKGGQCFGLQFEGGSGVSLGFGGLCFEAGICDFLLSVNICLAGISSDGSPAIIFFEIS